MSFLKSGESAWKFPFSLNSFNNVELTLCVMQVLLGSLIWSSRMTTEIPDDNNNGVIISNSTCPVY